MSIRIDYAPMNNAPTTADNVGGRMTEYIAEFTVEKKPFDFPNLMIHTHGELVRCHDCNCSSFDEFGGGWCDENCREIKQWDYCAWGERRSE